MNNNSSSKSLKKLKINLEYLGKTMGIEVEPYKTISQLKEKTRKLFFIVNLDFKLIHSNKDLTPFDSISLGEYFKNKSKIHLKLIQTSNLNYSKEINASGKNDKNSNYNENKSSYIGNLNNSLDRININDKENLLNLNNDDININNTHLNTLNNSNLNLDQIENLNNNRNSDNNISSRLKTRSITKNKNKADSSILISNNYESNVANNSKNICECNSKLVKSYYCRNDNSFICKMCRMDVNKRKIIKIIIIKFENF